MRPALRRKHRDRVGKPLEDFIDSQEAKHSNWQTWKCQACGATNTDQLSEQCQNCGRDFMGRPGNPPPRNKRDLRPGFRNDVASGFTDE